MGMTAALAVTAGSKVYGAQKGAAANDAAADQLQQEAGQSVASGIQGAINERRKAAYVESAAQARGAFGGGGSDPTVVNLISQIHGEGEYRALTSLYQGEDRASGLRANARARHSEADAMRTQGWLSGISTVLSDGSGSLYDKYGAGGSPGAG